MGQEQSTMQQPDDRNSERFSSAPSYKEINEERVKRSKNPQGNNLRQQGSLSSGVNTDGNEDPDRIKDFRPGRTNAAGPSNLAARSVNQQPNQTMSTLNDDQRDPESAKKRAAPPSAQAASSNNNKTTAHFGYAESGQFGVAEPVYSQQNNHDYPDNNASQDLLAQQQQQQYQWEQQQQQQPLYDERKREIIEKLLYNDPSLMESQTSKKIYTAEESQQLVHRLLEKGKQIETRNHLTTDYYDQREIENCTFQPNTVPESITLARSQSPKRSLQEFLNGQNKFLANRQENLKRVQTEIEYQEKQACSHAPQILQTSPIVMIQSKAARKYDSEPAYKRLFDLQKRKADAQKSKQQQKTEDDAAASKSTAKKPNPKTIDRLYNLGKKKVASKREGKPMESQNKEEKNEEQDQKQSQQQHQSVSKQIAQMNQPSQKQSEFCLATKLIKEYEHIVSIVVEDAKKQAYLLDYIQQEEHA